MSNLNEFFRKDVTYVNIKSHKKNSSTLSFENLLLEGPQGGAGGAEGGHIDPPSMLFQVNIQRIHERTEVVEFINFYF